MTSADVPGIRLNKFISDTGVCSRREADRFIEEGRVKINGQIALMGTRVVDGDQVTLNGKPLRAKPPAVYLIYNKPVGVTCTTDPRDRDNIVDAVRYPGGRIFPVGRLDKPSEGLILLTNDGDIVNKILRAGNAHEKEYVVTLDRPLANDFVRRMSAPIPILDTMTKPCQVRQISTDTFNIVLTQGLNRQIRRMAEYLGYEVMRLRRVRVMNLRLGGLRPGQWRELTPAEMAVIDRMLASSSKTEEASRIDAVPGTAGGRARKPTATPHAGERARRGKPSAARQPTAKNGARRSAKPGFSKR
ncbi:MAG: 23S rRNA pseudouridine(2604) synthase RluF [Gammaproteobacteria bacterium HGW-Gammaproteobacteria-14]|nr:MAG: 23S rRNA pseudouridine(2604) synthase RluF [Gammaproteobacteria bacterium HGW-Gammaproteobacteria-14]